MVGEVASNSFAPALSFVRVPASGSRRSWGGRFLVQGRKASGVTILTGAIPEDLRR